LTRRELLVLLVLGLAACGGGPPGGPAEPVGGGGGSGDGPLSGTHEARGSVEPREDQVLVKPRDPAALVELLVETGSSLEGPVLGTPWFVVRVPSWTNAVSFVSMLESDARVLAADLDVRLRSPEGDGRTIPVGGLMFSVQLPDQPELLRIGAGPARSRTNGAGVRVAVLDSGILFDHESVFGRVDADGYDFVDGDDDPTEATNGVDEDADGEADEDHGHGTFVSSVVLAVAPEARVVPIRVLDADGVGTASAIAGAITYAATHGAHVINLSVSVPPGVRVVRDAIESARLLGVRVITSAGNSGEEDPQAASSPVVVTAVDSGDVRADFATYGGLVDLAAPGVDIQGGYPPNPDTATWSGTSFSTAIVSGAYALVQSLQPHWTAEDVIARILETVVPVDAPNPGFEGRIGAGRLDLDAATR
jgi:subtilisin family serine protease